MKYRLVKETMGDGSVRWGFEYGKEYTSIIGDVDGLMMTNKGVDWVRGVVSTVVSYSSKSYITPYIRDVDTWDTREEAIKHAKSHLDSAVTSTEYEEIDASELNLRGSLEGR